MLTILGFETSFDDTAAAVVRNGTEILSNVMASQVDLFKDFGGVVPEIASRAHIQMLLPVMHRALSKAELTLGDMDALAVTYGPGLVGSLLVGVSVAKGLSYALGLSLYAINHVEAHIYAPLMTNPELEFPHICLSAAGGHTSLYLVKSLGDYQMLGGTRDDAAGEAFDKVSVAMGKGCPGGRAIEQLAAQSDQEGPSFPRPMMKSGDYDFSFSGLKTAVVRYLETPEGRQSSLEATAAAFQSAAVDLMVSKTLRAARNSGARHISLTGGVACNGYLYEQLKARCERKHLRVFRPPASLCTDNAAMVAGLAFHKHRLDSPAGLELNADPGLGLGKTNPTLLVDTPRQGSRKTRPRTP
ncbi:MAG TPA: tRNA (adenosine(37)-N6)-threonylcarbamoyltransferase complex transferase subunit TsaD [bacterium]|nr:tRNA (adenosine(37)-N6)-threonylcarbamoyltransferase complex transferase subunit TsaD [bacterium]